MSPYSSSSLKAEKEHRLLSALHWLSLPLIIGILGVGAYRSLGLKSATSNRMDFVVISAASPFHLAHAQDLLTDQAAKSVICLQYILLTTYISPLKRWYSARSVLVISIIDSVFWIAALALTAYGMIQVASSGTRAILNYTLVALLAVAFLLSLPILYLAWKQDRHVRAIRRGEGPDSLEVEMVRDEYLPRK